MSAAFDANRRLAELALWLDQGASWIDNVTGDARRAPGDVEVTFDRAELETFVTGLRGATRSLLGLVQPVPPDIGGKARGGHLRLVASS